MIKKGWMMNLSKEQLNQLTELGRRMVPLYLIAKALKVPEFELKEELRGDGEVSDAYYEGFTQTKIELNESIIKSAKNGSNPAQMELKKLIKQSEDYIS